MINEANLKFLQMAFEEDARMQMAIPHGKCNGSNLWQLYPMHQVDQSRHNEKTAAAIALDLRKHPSLLETRMN